MIAKKTLVSTFLTLLLISTLYVSNTFAQNYSKLNLPEGARVQLGKGRTTGGIAYSPYGNRLAVASSIGIWLYNAHTFVEVALLRGHTGYVSSIAFSPDSKTLISGGYDNTVRLWNVRTGTLLHTLEEHKHEVDDVAFSPDGKLFGSIDADDNIRVWDAHTIQRMYTIERGSVITIGYGIVNRLAFSADSKVLAIGYSHSALHLRDARTGKFLKSRGTQSSVNAMAFSSDGVTLATGAYGRGSIDLWGARTLNHWQTLGSHGEVNYVNSVVFSADGKTLASAGGDNNIKFWDAVTGVYLRTFTGHTSDVLGVSFNPNGNRIASVSSTEIRFWNANTGKLIHTLTGWTRSISSIALSPDGSTLAIGRRVATVQLMDVSTGKQTRRMLTWDIPANASIPRSLAYVRSVAFSPNGTILASDGYDGSPIYLWDAATGAHKRTFNGHKNKRVNCLSFSPDGTILASGGYDDTIHLWDVNTGRHTRTIETYDPVRSVSFSPDGQTLVSASFGQFNGGIYIFHVPTGRRLKTLVNWNGYYRTYSVAFSPDSSIIVGTVNNEIRFYDPRSGERMRTLTGHTADVRFVAFSPDGKTLVSVGDQEIRLWDVDTGEHTDTFWGHTDTVMGVLFSPDGQTLASGSWDGTVLLWNLTPSATPNVTPSTPATSNPVASGDVNKDGKVNAKDLRIVVNALGKKARAKPNADVNGDGKVDVDDLLVVIEHLDDPENAASPRFKRLTSTFQHAELLSHLNILRAQSDGSLKYQRAVVFLENLLTAAQPNTTTLLSNYPNPFNPETWIPYHLAEPADVTVCIHSADGRLVRTLELGQLPAGVYAEKNRAAYWDGRNTQGERVASGVYFYTLSVGDFSATRKMLIRK